MDMIGSQSSMTTRSRLAGQLPGRIFWLLCLIALLPASSVRADFPQSQVISSVTWDYGSLTATASGSDLWALAWASDGNQYTIWGDGGGFGGDDVNGRTQWGVARIEGSAGAWRGFNVYGGVNPEAPGWPMQDTTGSGIGFKVDSMTAVNGSLVAIMNNWAKYPNYAWKIIKSDDLGRSWKNSDGTPLSSTFWDWPNNTDGGFSPIAFIDMGKGYGLSTDGYVYFYRVFEYNKLYLGRVSKTSYMNTASYVYRKSDGSWVSGIENADAVLSNSDISGVNAIYHPYLKRYVLTFNCTSGAGRDESNMHDWMMLEGPSPWGPWSKIGEWKNWLDSTYKFQYRISAKWITNSSEFYLIFSGGSPQGSNSYDWDALHVIKGTFALAPTNISSAPMPPAGLAIH
jgi:hypothetical protein